MNLNGIAALSKENLAHLKSWAKAVGGTSVDSVPVDRLIRCEATALRIETPRHRQGLTKPERRAIAERYANGEDSAKLAREFGVSLGYASAEASRQKLRRVRGKRFRKAGPNKRVAGASVHKPKFGEPSP